MGSHIQLYSQVKVRMSDIKLTYFNGVGRAETCRLILAYAGVRYTDQRLTIDQFVGIKDKLPYGQLPVLKIEGESIAQSTAIARMLADKYGLSGRTNLEKAQADEIVDAINDIRDPFRKAIRDKDEEKLNEIISETIPKTMAKLEARLVERGGQFFAGNKLSWADLHMFRFVDEVWLFKSDLKILDDVPHIKNLMDRIEAEPNIAKWLQSRPSTPW